MKLKSKKRTLALVCALTATTAVPALALENEFHGMYRLGGVASNFVGSEAASYYTYNGSNMFAQDISKAGNNRKDQHPSNATFLDQRARLLYTAKIDDELKLVTKFEVNARWGDQNYGAGISGGGAVGSDMVNLRTKNVYLDYDFNLGIPMNAKIGIQSFGDSYKGIFFDNDAAAAIFKAKLEKGSVTAGFSRFADNGSLNSYASVTNNTGGANPTPNTNGNLFGGGLPVTTQDNSTMTSGIAYGDVSTDYWFLDGKYDINKNLSVGGSYYLLYSDIAQKLSGTNATAKYKERVHMVGVNATGKVGPAVVDGFFIYQLGKTTSKDISAFAANLGARMPVGPGTLRSELLYMSGDDGNDAKTTHGFTVIGGECGYMKSGMQILARDNSLVMTRNNALFYDNNAGQGIMLATLGYDLPLSKKLMFSSNVGYGAVESRNQHIVASSGSDLATEINISLPYKPKDTLTIAPRFAYAFLGDFYKGQAAGGKTPDDLYLASLVMSLAF